MCSQNKFEINLPSFDKCYCNNQQSELRTKPTNTCTTWKTL